jgi:carboxymethylenebutenolidase
MSEQELRIETPDGAMTTFIAHPDEGGPFPVVVVYMDALGLRDTLREFGRRIAEAGYYAVVPDLYYRAGDGIVFDAAKLGDPEGEEMQRMFAMIQQVNDESVMSDTQAILDHAAGDPLASAGPSGCVGFCLGGRLVVRALQTFPDEFAAGSALHPSFIVGDGPDSPHLDIEKIRGELYVGLGGADAFQPPEAFEPARAELERHGVAHQADVHDGADHGFMLVGAPMFQETAAEASWAQTFDLFRRRLQGAPVAAG